MIAYLELEFESIITSVFINLMTPCTKLTNFKRNSVKFNCQKCSSETKFKSLNVCVRACVRVCVRACVCVCVCRGRVISLCQNLYQMVHRRKGLETLQTTTCGSSPSCGRRVLLFCKCFARVGYALNQLYYESTKHLFVVLEKWFPFVRERAHS